MSKDITAKDVKRLMMRNYRRYSNGEISENKAYKENALLANILKAIEMTETEERLSALESALMCGANDEALTTYGDEEE